MRRLIIIVIASAFLLYFAGAFIADRYILANGDDAAKHAQAPLPSGVTPGQTPTWCLTNGFSEQECKEAYR